jgi:hypothetical protein
MFALFILLLYRENMHGFLRLRLNPLSTDHSLSFNKSGSAFRPICAGSNRSSGNNWKSCGPPGINFTRASPPATCHLKLTIIVSPMDGSKVPQRNKAGGNFGFHYPAPAFKSSRAASCEPGSRRLKINFPFRWFRFSLRA